MRPLASLSLFLFLSLGPLPGFASEGAKKTVKTIHVGAVEFPPYIHIEPSGKVTGILATLLEFMNAEQKNYFFQAIPISAMRRHSDFKNGLYDMSFFDNIDWGWDKSTVDVSNVYMRGKELYIAKQKPSRDESYFKTFEGKTIIGILGYHYGFAGFNADPAFLRKKFNMQLSTSSEGSIKMVLFDRGDIAVVSDIYLDYYFEKNPEDKQKILISNKIDQQYAHTVIVRKNIRPTAKEINDLLSRFRKSKKYKEVMKHSSAEGL